MQAERIIQIISEWVKTRPTIHAAALVGSQARGVARPDSDIDLVLLVTDPEKFRVDTGWLHEIGWTRIGARPARWTDEDYGALWSRRLWLEPTGDEIEFGFAMPSWAETRPIDPGTQRVIANGCRSLHDPQGLLSYLCKAVHARARAEKRSAFRRLALAPKSVCWRHDSRISVSRTIGGAGCGMKTWRNARGAQRFAFPPYSCYYLMKFRHCVDRDCLRFALFYQG